MCKAFLFSLESLLQDLTTYIHFLPSTFINDNHSSLINLYNSTITKYDLEDICFLITYKSDTLITDKIITRVS